MNDFSPLLDFPLFLLTIVLSLSIVLSPTAIIIDRLPQIRFWSKKSYLKGQKEPANITSLECPYSYIRQIYGHYHWAPFVEKLSPTLKDEDPAKYKMVLEIMDTIHLCLMLVDDVSGLT
jgi:geranylgeranyldiphosphate transferase